MVREISLHHIRLRFLHCYCVISLWDCPQRRSRRVVRSCKSIRSIRKRLTKNFTFDVLLRFVYFIKYTHFRPKMRARPAGVCVRDCECACAREYIHCKSFNLWTYFFPLVSICILLLASFLGFILYNMYFVIIIIEFTFFSLSLIIFVLA